MKFTTFHYMKNGLTVYLLINSILFSGCATLTPEIENHAEFASLGDPKAELTYSTAFPVASAEEAIIRGDEAMSRGDADRALFEYVRALEKKGADGELLYKVGRVHLILGDTRRAELSFILVLKELPEHVGALTELGRLQMKRRDYAAAEKLLSKALEITPDSPRIYNTLGVLKDVQKNHHQAQAYFAKAISLVRTNPLYLNNMGYSRYLMGDLDGAEQAFVNALKLDSGYERAWRNLALVYAKNGRFKEALDAFNKIEEEHQALNDVGYVAMVSGRYDDAHRFFQEAIRVAPMYYEIANSNAKQLELVKERNSQPK